MLAIIVTMKVNNPIVFSWVMGSLGLLAQS